MVKKVNLFISTIVLVFMLSTLAASASKLVSATIVDRDYIMLHYRDGDVVFNERAVPEWALYESNQSMAKEINKLVTYGEALNTTKAANAKSWKITSTDDSGFGKKGVAPATVYRKSKLGCMAQMGWDMAGNKDFLYDWAYEHTIFLKMPRPLKAGKSYTITIPADINSDVATQTVIFDIFNNRSEAVKVNIVGYATTNSIKAADVYLWMGDGGARDYSAFVGKKIYIYNTATKKSQEVGALSFWQKEAAEMTVGHKMLQTSVWKADFTGFNTAGTYRLAVEDIGCSDDFTIKNDIYYEPLRVSTLGFYYMRVGEDSKASGITPVARIPLYIPEKSPPGCKVHITSVHPFHPGWAKLSGGIDKWDEPGDKKKETDSNWYAYITGRTNPNVYGGHSDALDWDRQLSHVTLIYDILLPYFLTKGAISDDNFGIPESGNGIPDVLDEARNEVDFWLRLRDGKGYSHGITNPTTSTTDPVFFQAAGTGMAAWANAANSAMLGDCFRILSEQTNLPEHKNLMERYRDSAVIAYDYASNLPPEEQLLNEKQPVGDAIMLGNDFKMTAAAFLYNLTGNVRYENDLVAGSRCKTDTSGVSLTFGSSTNNDETIGYSEMYAVAGYLLTNRKVNHPARYNNMKNSIVAEAKAKEANYSDQNYPDRRPSRRSSKQDAGMYVSTMNNNQRTIIAHAISEEGSADKKMFENALILEADYSLGRNPLNMILMTTATTNLESKKSVENAYTSGWNDGTPGVHPGHAPYMNYIDWNPGGMAMGNPSWMTSKNYPAASYWPIGELYYNTRYVYAANEFTPQETLRGKMALYGYLYGIRKN